MPVNHHRLAGLVLALLFAGCSPGPGDGSEKDQGAPAGETVPEGKLPDLVEPLSYELELHLDPKVERFSGRVAIRLRLADELDWFWMHGKELQVATAYLESADGTVVPATFDQVHRDGIAVLRLGEPVAAQEAVLTLEYQGRLATDASGLFRSESAGDSYIFSDFQPILARSAFPSFDEPRFKTPFTVSIVTPTENGAFSNGQDQGVEILDGGSKRVRFATTRPLPTYLVAFAVGPLDVVEWEPIVGNEWRAEPIPLRGISARGRGDSLRFALANTATMLLALENYFRIPYPYEKLDLVAVVGFSGAMENAGLITYDEYTLLLDESASLARQEAFGSTHAHELAHQWLGNLVTMAWWDDLWMNESFASWMEEKLMALWRPEMHYARTRLAYTHRAMDRDSLASSRRVREPVTDAAGMYDAFDSATYSKGAAVIRMVEEYVGEEAFRDALSGFLRQFAHRSATVFDLVDSMEERIGPEAQLQAIFRSFLFQPGVPYVTATLRCDDDGGQIALSQARYIPDGSLAPVVGEWTIPLCLRWEGDGEAEPADRCYLLTSTETDLVIDGRCPAWFIPNKGADGYYRWQTPHDTMDLLDIAGIVFDDLERMSLEDSLAARMLAGDLTAGQYLAAVPALAAGLERAVVTAPLADLAWILDHAVPPDDLQEARSFLGAIYRRRLDFIDLPGGAESDEEASRLRSRLVEFLGRVVEDPDVRRDLVARGRRYVGFGANGRIDPDAVAPELVEAAVSVAARDGGAEFFDHLVRLLGNETAPEVRDAIVSGIGATNDPVLLVRARNLLLEEVVSTNEVWVLLDALSRPQVLEGTWAWLGGNLDRLLDRYPGSYRYGFPGHFDRFCSAEKAEELRSRFEPYFERIPGIERMVGKTAEQILICTAFRERNTREVSRFLRDLGRAERDGRTPGIAAGAEEG
jgi:alanyl aminopeptidase